MRYLALLTILFLFSCQNQQSIQEPKPPATQTIKVDTAVFAEILEQAQVNGSILFYNPEGDSMLSNDFEWAAVQRIPASTFKIVNSIIGLETGVVGRSKHHVSMGRAASQAEVLGA